MKGNAVHRVLQGQLQQDKEEKQRKRDFTMLEKVKKSYCSFFSMSWDCFSWGLEELLEVSGCANSRFDCMSDDSSQERIQNLPLAEQLTNKLFHWTQSRCQIGCRPYPRIFHRHRYHVYLKRLKKERIRRRWEHICWCFEGIVNLSDCYFFWLIIPWLSKDLVSVSL